MARIARLLVDGELIRKALKLPATAEFMDVRMAPHQHGAIEFKILAPALDEVAPGGLIPLVTVEVSTLPSGLEISEFKARFG